MAYWGYSGAMILFPPRRKIWLCFVCAVLAASAASFASAAPQLPPINQPPTNQRLSGKLIWFDLLTNNVDAAKQFYGSVFGWTFSDVPDSQRRFSVISIGNERIGGIFQPASPAAAGRPAHWLTFISVPDVDATARYAKSNGGQILAGPTSVPARGTHLVMRDPQGALFGVLKSDSGDPLDDPAQPGEILWADLFVSKPVDAAAFYRGLVGWRSGRRAAGGAKERLVMSAGGFARAGITVLPDGAKPGWLPYVQVQDVAATLKRVTNAGGRILTPPSPDVLGGRLAVIADPQGGVIGVVHWIPPGKKGGSQ